MLKQLTQQDYLYWMEKSILEAGQIARRPELQKRSTLKPDGSVLTKADQTIARFMHRKLAPWIKQGNHLLIDEEDLRKDDYFNQEKLSQYEYIWSIDPIDGTRLYANRVPNYGISIGCFRNLKPWLGAVYFPQLDELFIGSALKAYFVQGLNRGRKVQQLIKKIDQRIDKRSLFYGDDDMLHQYRWDDRDCKLMMSSCAVVDLCWPAIGRGCGALLHSHLWDFAGSWPICLAAGLGLRHLETGKELTTLDLKVFLKNPVWKLKDFFIVSSEQNFSVLKSRLKLK